MEISILKVVLLAGAVQGFCLALLLFSRSANHLANLILGILICILSFQIILVSFDERAFFMAFPHLSRISWLLPTLFGPLLYLFTKRLTSQKPRFSSRDFLHMIPFLSYLLLLSPYYFQSAAAKRRYLNNFEVASTDDFGILNQLTNLMHISYVLAAIVLLHRHQKKIEDLFSSTTRVTLRWLKDFLYLALVAIVLGVFAFYSRKWNLTWLTHLYHYHYLAVVIIIYWIGYKTLSHPDIFQALSSSSDSAGPKEEVIEKQAEKYNKSGLQAEDCDLILKKLEKHMQEQKPYLRNELNLRELASELEVSKHHLSQVINEKLHLNFFSFINLYRIEEAKRLLLHPAYAHYNTLAIAMEAGFNSKATFNAVFKKYCGVTPTAFVEQNGN